MIRGEDGIVECCDLFWGFEEAWKREAHKLKSGNEHKVDEGNYLEEVLHWQTKL